jgi:hypothetical protein
MSLKRDRGYRSQDAIQRGTNNNETFIYTIVILVIYCLGKENALWARKFITGKEDFPNEKHLE